MPQTVGDVELYMGPEQVGGPDPPRRSGVRSGGSSDDYIELKRLVKQSGLLERAPTQLWNQLAIMVALAVSVAIIVLSDSLFVQLVNGAFLGLVFAHIGFVMHDAGHRQIFRSAASNDIIGMLCANLLTGLSYSGWMDKHNRHHNHPNQLDHDPDIDFPVVVFSENEALAKPAPWSYLVRYQAFLFFPLLLLSFLSLRVSTLSYLVYGRAKQPSLEWSLLAFHYCAYFGLAFTLLELGPAIGFVAVHNAVVGLYGGLVFAPNHKGMSILEQHCQLSFLERQVTTSRTVRGHPITDFLYGGLNYQIEHHLFPALPRERLPAAHRLVKAFCRKRGIPYHETNMVQAMKEVISHLHRVSAPLRARKRRISSD